MSPQAIVPSHKAFMTGSSSHISAKERERSSVSEAHLGAEDSAIADIFRSWKGLGKGLEGLGRLGKLGD
jgi:hypothetical protein